MSELRQSILEALAFELPDPKNSTAAAMEFLHQRTIQEASVWITFLMLVSSAIVSFKKIPWGQPTKRRVHAFSFGATVLSAIYYLLLVWFLPSKKSCSQYHLADPTASAWEWENWKLGAGEDGGSQLEICPSPPPLERDWFQRRFLLIVWVSQLATCAGNSLATGFTVHGLITVFDHHDKSTSAGWQMVLKFWPWSVMAASFVWSIYRAATRSHVQYRKFVLSLIGYVSVLYILQGL